MLQKQVVEFHDDDFHSYTLVQENGKNVARIEMAGVYQEKEAVWAEVTVHYLFDGRSDYRPIAHKRTNLLNIQSGPKLAGEMDAMTTDVWEWDRIMEGVFQSTIDAIRLPPKPDVLDPTNQAEPMASFLLEPFVLHEGVSLLFGPGGTGKSLIALSFGVAIASGRTVFGRKPTASGPVLYLDYEDTRGTHERRLAALLSGLDMTADDMAHPIYHLRPRTSISKARRDLKAQIRTLDPALVIVDSVGLGRGGDATGSEETIRFFSTLNQLDVPVLGIDHMNKDDTRSGKMLTPYGSIYTVNSVRLAWAVKAAAASEGDLQYLDFVQTKRNNVADHAPLGGVMEFHNEQIGFGEDGDIFQPVLRKVTLSLSDQWWDAEEASLLDRIVDHLDMNGTHTSKEVADALNASPQQVRTRLLEGAKAGRVELVSQQGRNKLWNVPT